MKLNSLKFLLLILSISFYSVLHCEVFHVDNITQANSAAQNPGDIVFIKGGRYAQALRPNISGSEAGGGYITYMPEPGDTVTIYDVNVGINVSLRSYIQIDGFRIVDVEGGWIDIVQADHIIVKNCYMDSLNGGWNGVNILTAHHVKLIGNTLRARCPCNDGCFGLSYGGPDDLIGMTSCDHNLFEENRLYDGIHDNFAILDRTDGLTGYNIFRNNYLSNKWHGNFDIWGPEYLLIENNIVVDAGEEHWTNYCSRSNEDPSAERWRHKGILINTSYGIVRNNILVNNGRGLGVESAESDSKYPWKSNAINNRLYNNTSVENRFGINKHAYIDPLIDNIFKNNIFYKDSVSVRILGSPSNSQYINNNSYGAQAASTYSSEDVIIGEMNEDPLFFDEENRDFHLTENSQMIDAGAWLTTTKSAGNGIKIPVKDVQYFMDGWGLIEGDLIQLQGQTQRARIINVNYVKDELTIDTYLEWDAGQGVALAYIGDAPDIGAFEYGQGIESANQAGNPSPANGVTGVNPESQLSWSIGEDAVSHNVFFNTDDSVIFIQNQEDTVYNPGTLEYNKTYYWRIDEITTTDTVKGNIWSFTTSDVSNPPEIATNPEPVDNVDNMNNKISISWKPGRRAVLHIIYFGMSNPPDSITTQSESEFDPGDLEFNKIYFWRIDEKNEYGTTQGEIWSFKTKEEVFLPEGWVAKDIGDVGLYGEGKLENKNTFIVEGSGTDIWDKQDAFQYVYISLNGNGEISARVVSMENTDPWAKAGVMIRETLEPASKYAMMFVSAENGIAYQKRTNSGISSERFPGSTVSAPYWIKLVRFADSYFIGYESSDGKVWKTIKTEQFSMNESVYAGLAVTAADNDSLCTAMFDSVYVNGELVTSLKDLQTNIIPHDFRIANYPNPFNPTTKIRLDLPKAGKISITIYDITGRKVKELLNDSRNAGVHYIEWDAANTLGNKVASGLYIYRVVFDKNVKTGKMLLMR